MYLVVGSQTIISDSYYFGLDTNGDNGERFSTRVQDSLRLLLLRWQRALEEVELGHAVYLPFDFSDQYVGCLKCTCSNSDFEITSGYVTDCPGHRLLPSKPDKFLTNPGNFKSNGRLDDCISKNDVWKGLVWSIDETYK